MRQRQPLLVLVILALGLFAWRAYHTQTPGTPGTRPAETGQTSPSTGQLPAFLPAEARDMVARIARGGPFEHRQDGGVFGNYEGRLPKQPRGYYHEYTVETPGARNRGARRIITGGKPPTVWYYTGDHYESFRRFEVNR